MKIPVKSFMLKACSICRSLGFLLPVLILAGCPNYGYKYNEGWLPVHPENLEDINSAFDDYNSTAPTIGSYLNLCFSTNRNSLGEQYDIINRPIYIEFSKITGELYVGPSFPPYDWVESDIWLARALDSIQSPANELGPLVCTYDNDRDEKGWYASSYFLYASDGAEQLDIYYTLHKAYDGQDSLSEDYGRPEPLSFLNSPANDAYPCFNSNASALWFCSDRGGNYDIYYVESENNMDIPGFLAGDEATVSLDTVLSSPGNDKCPYIAYHSLIHTDRAVGENLLVFASDREGGYGGFDLYFSVLEDGRWTTPENFGASVNSEYDEYRPIVVPLESFQQDFMLFSSNRPGGKGGFDLYYVGIGDIGCPYY